MKRTYASGGEEEALMDSLLLEEGADGGRVFRALSATHRSKFWLKLKSGYAVYKKRWMPVIEFPWINKLTELSHLLAQCGV